MLPLECPWAASDLIGQRIGTGQEGVKKKRDKSRHEWVDNE